MTTIGIILALLFLEWPLKGIVIGVLALFEIVEISIFLKWRRTRAMTGSEGMIGAEGIVITDCAPEGQVKIGGRFWKARCADGVRAGEPIKVAAVDGLMLEVEPDAKVASRSSDKARTEITRR
ncbi:MAG: NfeD family protein [Actinomycetota bacterium]